MSIIGGNLGYYSYQFSAVGNRSSLLQKSFYTPFAAGGLACGKNNFIFVGGNLGYSNITLGNFQGGLKNGEKLVE